jgi:hypothetical protein
VSENHPTAVTLTKVPLETAIEVMGQSLEMLVRDYEFGFRGWGGPMQMFFEDGGYDEDVIDEQLRQADFSRETVARFVQRYKWFSLEGSIRLPNVDRLCGLDIVLYPTFDEANPACVIFVLDSWFLESVWGRAFDRYDKEAADTLVKLSVALGAHDLVDGFITDSFSGFDENLLTFDAAHLRTLLFQPALGRKKFAKIEEMLAVPSVGLVTGIKTSVVSAAELQLLRRDGVTLRTINGFAVLSILIEADFPGRARGP